MKILIVEDDPIQRGVIAATLTARGDTVIEAESGEAAVEIVTSGIHHFDSILMDQRMPGMTGAEAVKRIRTLPDWRGQVPIVAMSASDMRPHPDIDGIMSKDSLARVQDIMVDAAAAAQVRVINAQDPPRKVLVNWMRLNLLAMVSLLVAFVGSVGGGIWGTSAYTADQRHQNADVTARLDNGQKAMADVDRRLNELAMRQGEAGRETDAALANARREADAALANARREIEANRTVARRDIDASLAALKEEIAVLKARYAILADRAQQQPPPLIVPGRRP